MLPSPPPSFFGWCCLPHTPTSRMSHHMSTCTGLQQHGPAIWWSMSTSCEGASVVKQQKNGRLRTPQGWRGSTRKTNVVLCHTSICTPPCWEEGRRAKQKERQGEKEKGGRDRKGRREDGWNGCALRHCPASVEETSTDYEPRALRVSLATRILHNREADALSKSICFLSDNSSHRADDCPTQFTRSSLSVSDTATARPHLHAALPWILS